MSDSGDPTPGTQPPPRRPLPPELDPRRPAPAPRRSGGARHVVPAGRVRKPRRWARVLSWIAVVTSISVLAAAGAGYALVRRYDGNISRIDVFGNRTKTPTAANKAQNFLIVGSDSRGNLKAGEGTQGRGASFVTGQRSDTVILAHLYGGRSNKVQLVSFPRDSVVEVPAYTDPKGVAHEPQKAKLNAAFFEGGPPLLVQTIEALTGLTIDHYLQVDFNGFQTMVDKLGGVDVCLSRPAREKDSGINLSAGRHHINGAVALSFVRQRKKLPNGDIDRIKRQQQFIGAMVRKVLSAGTLANPFKLNGFLKAATSSLTADNGLTPNQLRNLAFRFRNVGAGNIIFATVPITTSNGYDRRLGSVVLIDQPKATALFAQMEQDIPPGTPAAKPSGTAAQALTVPPAAIRVSVFNGSGINGLGRKADAELSDQGFQTVGQPQTRGTGAAPTTVLYGPDRADSARTVAAAIPGSVTQLDPELGRVLQVVVGTSYTGVQPVKITRTTPATPGASPTPKVLTALDDPCAA
jgi:LCP family protein required for cell wall assembly